MPRTKAKRSKGHKHLYIRVTAGLFAAEHKLPESNAIGATWGTDMIDAGHYDEGELAARLIGDQTFSQSYGGNFIFDNTLLRALIDAKAAGDSVYVLYVYGEPIAAGAKNVTFMYEAGIGDFSTGDGDVTDLSMALEALEMPVIEHDVETFPTYA